MGFFSEEVVRVGGGGSESEATPEKGKAVHAQRNRCAQKTLPVS